MSLACKILFIPASFSPAEQPLHFLGASQYKNTVVVPYPQSWFYSTNQDQNLLPQPLCSSQLRVNETTVMV